MVDRVSSSDLSPIYRDLYNRVIALPEFVALTERAHEDVRQTQIVAHTYRKAQYGNRVECHARIRVRHRIHEIEFAVEGSEKTPYFHFDTGHLVTDREVDDIYLNNVGRFGKPIRPHGLVKENTVLNGAAPRGKNQFSPYARSYIFNNPTFDAILKRVKQRIHQELIAKLTSDPNFVEFSEGLQTEDIVKKLLDYSHLPPDVLHRAVDLMYVQATMEK
jgi:hypothetical protein